jgi:predicted aspartyl protease
MPISDFPFLKASDADPTPRPWLFVRIQNPATGAFVHTIGLIDTGADECCLPAAFAKLLGHSLTAGMAKVINTGNGATTAYGHTCTIDIFDTRLLLSGKEKVAHTMPQTIVDFIPNLHCVLLGVRTFLSRFELTVNYPRQLFSIRKPI